MRYHHFSTHTCVLPRCDETENILKKMFSFKHCPKRGWGSTATTGGSLLFQADVLSSMANGAMVYKKWQSRCWQRSSNLPPHTFFRNIYFRKMKTDKYQVWFYHGSDKPWSDHICRPRAAGGCWVCVYFSQSRGQFLKCSSLSLLGPAAGCYKG